MPRSNTILRNARGETVREWITRCVRIGGPGLSLSTATRLALLGERDNTFYSEVVATLNADNGNAPINLVLRGMRDGFVVAHRGRLLKPTFITEESATDFLRAVTDGTVEPVYR